MKPRIVFLLLLITTAVSCSDPFAPRIPPQTEDEKELPGPDEEQTGFNFNERLSIHFLA